MFEMAEADTVSPTLVGKRYFCHACNRQIGQLTLPEYLCPHCSSGFVEELPEAEESLGFGRPLHVSTAQAGNSSLVVERGIFDFPFSNFHRQGEEAPRHRPRYSLRVSGNPRVQQETHMPENSIDQFVQQLFLNLGMSATMDDDSGGMFGRIPRIQFGDYAWGQNGLDNIISQLLNQFEGTGPPPAEKEKVEKLPVVNIQAEDVVDGMTCAVCKDEYILDEEVVKLPCKHLFHDQCVKPWLELHDSCPVCRCSLNGEPTSQFT